METKSVRKLQYHLLRYFNHHDIHRLISLQRNNIRLKNYKIVDKKMSNELFTVYDIRATV